MTLTKGGIFMAVGNQSNIDTCIDHERLSRIRDIEFPNTVRKSHKGSAMDGLTDEEIEKILYPSSNNQSQKKSSDKTQFYDSQMRRI